MDSPLLMTVWHNKELGIGSPMDSYQVREDHVHSDHLEIGGDCLLALPQEEPEFVSKAFVLFEDASAEAEFEYSCEDGEPLCLHFCCSSLTIADLEVH